MKPILAFAVILAASASAQPISAWGQCGGVNYSGSTSCVSGYHCVKQNEYYSQCVKGTGSGSTGSSTGPSSTSSSTGPRSTGSSSTGSSDTVSTSSSSGGASSGASCAANTPPTSAGSLKLGGVNIAGFDFGCSTDGTCSPGGADPPSNGQAQMEHFQKDGFNTFRLPVGWQYLTNSVLGGTLDSTNFGKYDTLVRQCLKIGAYCIIDIHNYARWNSQIIGQGGPTNDQFANLWSQLATAYAKESKVLFGIMNEPHDVPDITKWAASVQAAVTAIRKAGATTQMILLPGNNWASAETFISSGSADALSAVKNLDGTTTNLIFDVHKYLDADNSGTNAECTKNNIDNAFAPLAQYLRCHGRQAIVTETGGGNVQSCVTYFCQQLEFLNKNSDVYLGFTGWGAGSFATSYVLSETPNSDGSDQLLVSKCMIPNFHP